MDNIQKCRAPERDDSIPILPQLHGIFQEQLIERDRKRQEEIILKRQNCNQLAEEHPDFIAQKFSELAEDIRDRIEESVKYFTHNPLGGGSYDECDSPQKKFASFAEQIGELQRYLTSCTRFLPDYKIKACTETINELNKTLDESRQRIIPKKKFGFSARKGIKTSEKKENICDEKEKSDPSKPVIGYEPQPAQSTIINKPLTNIAINLNRNLIDRQNEYIIESKKDINNRDIILANLKDCFIELQGHPSSIRADNLRDCILLMGPVSTSVYAENCHNTTFAIACQQLRFHSSTFCRVYLHVTCRAIIEDCKNIKFGCYNYNYAEVEQDFNDANLDKNVNNFTDIADFNWLTPYPPSPNWSLIEKSEISIDFQTLRQDFQAKLENAYFESKS